MAYVCMQVHSARRWAYVSTSAQQQPQQRSVPAVRNLPVSVRAHYSASVAEWLPIDRLSSMRTLHRVICRNVGGRYCKKKRKKTVALQSSRVGLKDSSESQPDYLPPGGGGDNRSELREGIRRQARSCSSLLVTPRLHCQHTYITHDYVTIP